MIASFGCPLCFLMASSMSWSVKPFFAAAARSCGIVHSDGLS